MNKKTCIAEIRSVVILTKFSGLHANKHLSKQTKLKLITFK